MASVYDYTFNQHTRIGNDKCDMSQRSIQNSASANYNLNNYFPDCAMSNAINFATSQPTVMYNGSKQVGINGCNINENSQLKYSELSKDKSRITLMQRPFLTIPYLGRGKTDFTLESEIQQGDHANNRKSANPSSEVSYLDLLQTPLIPTLHEELNNPANHIEGVAAEGWIRGGLPSRELTRDKEYHNSHTSHQYN